MSTKYSLIPLNTGDSVISLHSITIDGIIYFPAVTTLKSFGYVDTDKAIRNNISDGNKLSYTELTNQIKGMKSIPAQEAGMDFIQEFNASLTLSGINIHSPSKNRMVFITEAGLYEFLYTSNKTFASIVVNIMLNDVMPAVRKFGMYVDPEMQKSLVQLTGVEAEVALYKAKEQELLETIETLKQTIVELTNKHGKTNQLVEYTQKLVEMKDEIIEEKVERIHALADEVFDYKYIQAKKILNGYGNSERLLPYTSKTYVGVPSTVARLFNYKTGQQFYTFLKNYKLIRNLEKVREPTAFAEKFGLIRKNISSYNTPMFTDFGLAVLFYLVPENMIDDDNRNHFENINDHMRYKMDNAKALANKIKEELQIS